MENLKTQIVSKVLHVYKRFHPLCTQSTVCRRILTKLQLNEFKSHYVNKQRFNSHLTSTNLNFIKVMGTPLSKFNIDEYVMMKLLSGRRRDGEEKGESGRRKR